MVFEISPLDGGLRTSEVLKDFSILCDDRKLYSGRAVITSFVNTGLATVCEASLEDSWDNPEAMWPAGEVELRNEFGAFIQEWQKLYRVLPEFKATIADFQTFLTDLRLWLEQLELKLRSSTAATPPELQASVAAQLSAPVVNAIDGFIVRFEEIASRLEPEVGPIHRLYLRRQLHPLLLCSPFAHRTFKKPLGYAGDYEVVNMMMRPPHEGGTIFARIINAWLLGQAPVLAHQNRIKYLKRTLLEEAARAAAQGRRLRILNVGCGPALEVQEFMREQPVSNQLDFDLLDFNEDTLRDLRAWLERIQHEHHRQNRLRFIKKSVYQLLKEGGRMASGARQYDLVYCAGLFDYLSDQVCERLLSILYDLLAPGGLLLATNVSDALNASRPFRYSLEYILDWHLIYRDGPALRALAPANAAPDKVKVLCEDTGVNVFLETRKANDV
ncbi:MAG TPA: class I SAM-dependent methyltransferase [Candidatus Acidoferrum sp.]|nr:class I SAM-dependent methyltransferase [Candidatus Acidoferrum sp.]